MARARQARSVETRARLLSAARAVIAEHGIEGASVDAIAQRAERTSGSLYGQFGSKDGLLVALLDESKDLVASRMLADLEAAATLDGRLAALWRNFAEPPRAARDWIQVEHEVWVWATRAGNHRARSRLGERYRAHAAALGAALAEWHTEGLIDLPAPPEQAATLVVGALVGLEMSYRLDPASVDEATAVAALRRLIGARAAAAPSGRPRPAS
ncbi:MAG TPA: helix-turn-helix domain-containing protein [Acidimicrobiales bacterium]|nr:helix-turn-helix domain-containing protein [Acidimicrobiales bacterium]